MASLSKCHRCPTTMSIWTMLVLYEWKLIHKGEIFYFPSCTPTKRIKKICPCELTFIAMFKTIIVQMASLSDNDVNLDNDALNVCFNPQVPPPTCCLLKCHFYSSGDSAKDERRVSNCCL